MNPWVKSRQLTAALESIERECQRVGSGEPLAMLEALAFIGTVATEVLRKTR